MFASSLMLMLMLLCYEFAQYLEASNKAKKCFPCKTRGLARPGHDFPVLNRKYFLCNDCSRPVMRSRKIKEYLLTPKETAGSLQYPFSLQYILTCPLFSRHLPENQIHEDSRYSYLFLCGGQAWRALCP